MYQTKTDSAALAWPPTYGPGTFPVAEAGTPHGPHGTAGGCVPLTTYAGPPDFVPEPAGGPGAGVVPEV